MNETTETKKAVITGLPWACGPTGSRMRREYSQPHGITDNTGTQIVAGCFGDVRGGEDQAKANSEFIVRAVNNHAALVEALKDSLGVLKSDLDLARFQMRKSDCPGCFEDAVNAKTIRIETIEYLLRKAEDASWY